MTFKVLTMRKIQPLFLLHPQTETWCRTHPDRLLAQPGAPRHLSARLHRRVIGELEQRLELLGLTVGEHRPHPGLLTRLRLGGMVPVVTRQRRSIWWKKENVEVSQMMNRINARKERFWTLLQSLDLKDAASDSS